MKEQLRNYIDLLFAGAADAEDIKQEILQNTLDRYDDLIAQGKSPEAAYRLAISGIGDVSELLSSPTPGEKAGKDAPVSAPEKPLWKRLLKAAAIFLYIISVIPLFVLGDMNMGTIGLCGTLSIAAVATALLIIASGGGRTSSPAPTNGQKEHRAKLSAKTAGLCWAAGIAVYLLVSFLSGAWSITWIIFCMVPCVTGIMSGVVNLSKGKAGPVVKIVLLSLLLLLLVCILVFGMNGGGITIGYSDFGGLPNGIEASSGEFAASDIQNLDIRWVSGNVLVQRSDTASTSITFSEDAASDAQKLAYRVDGDTLIIAYAKDSGWQFGINLTPNEKTLTVTVPDSWSAEQLRISTVSASIDVDDLKAEKASLSTVSGDITLSAQANDLQVDSVSGDVNFTGAFLNFRGESVSGNCELAVSQAPKEIEFETVSGNLRLHLPESCGFVLSLDSVSGEYISTIPVTSANGRKTYGNGECTVIADTVSGNVFVYQDQ